MEIKESRLAIVVASCDKYSDLWIPFFGEFFTHWKDCPYPVYLVANHKVFEHERVTTLLAGDDVDWSTTVIRCTAQLECTHCLFFIDDAFLTCHVDTRLIDDVMRFILEVDANFVRLRVNPKPSALFSKDIGILDRSAAYRVSLFATIWKLETLIDILRPGESAWAFELEGTERSRKLGGFYCVIKDVFRYLHGVERGVWIRSTASVLSKRGYKLDHHYRRYMSIKEDLGLRFRLFKSFILHLAPERHRMKVLRTVQQFYRLCGLR